MLSTIKLKLAEQAQNPKGWFGRHIISRIFNKKNMDMEQIGMDQMNPVNDDHILEIGFGNGRLLSELAPAVKNGKVCGIDISGDMVDMAKRRNNRWIKRGLVDIRKASVSDIPFENSSFDKIFTANTIYFWPDTKTGLNEIKRVLKPGGQFYCAVRSKEFMESLPPVRDNRQIYRNLYDGDEIVSLFERAEFGDILIQNESNIILASAEKR